RAFLVLGARDPLLARHGPGLRLLAARIARIAALVEVVADASHEIGLAHRFALPVTGAHELLLHARLLDGVVRRLHDGPFFVFRHGLADLAGLGLHDRNFLDAANGALADLG